MSFKRLWIVACTAVLTACGGGGDGDGDGMIPAACSVNAQKTFVRDVTNEWYLFPELLPAQVNIGSFDTAQELLDFMTEAARDQGKDRYFSYLTTKQADSSFLQEGQFIGFGFRVRIEGDQVFFMEAFENSPASEAGIARGQELLAIDSGAGFVGVANILPTDPNLSEAFGPATEGIVRGFRFAAPGQAAVEKSLTKRVVTILPIPQAGGVTVLTLPDSDVRVGYVNLRTFISTADTQLRNAFSGFAAQGIQNVIIDLRYNGGGLISIAELVGDLLGGLRRTTDVYNHIRFRPSKSSRDETRYFRPIANTSVDAVSIAFITTGGSASASELVVNAMKPWANVAIIGDDTYGKPVGQSAFDLGSQCETRLRLVTLRSTNADEEGDYYNGLASTLPGAACAADDDLSRPMGDPAETSTAEALQWLGSGACSELIPPPVAGARKLAPGRQVVYPMPARPSPAQVHLPGLF